MNKNVSIAALVCGLVSVVLSLLSGFVGLWVWVGVALGIVAIVMGVKGRKKVDENDTTGMATAGLVLGIIGVVLCAITGICAICAACTVAAVGNALGGADLDELQSALGQLENELSSLG
ncbi:MAG: DUF4190 domain-containing protein [Acutalibacteraceae bacterium]